VGSLIEKITEVQQLRVMKNVFQMVFKTSDPFGEMFQNNIQEILIICPTDGYYLNQDQFMALQETVVAMGEDKIYLSEVETENCFCSEACSHWHMPSTIQYEDYIRLPVILENSLYSKEGKWGIIISQEEHAVIGGTTEFMTKYKKLYTDWASGISNFQQKWDYNKKHYNSDLSWYSKFCTYIRKT
jgi:hypothetical protein